MAESLQILMNRLPQTGEVRWIGVRPEKRAAITVLDRVRQSVEQPASWRPAAVHAASQ